MFFWIGVAVMLVVAGAACAWAMRGAEDRLDNQTMPRLGEIRPGGPDDRQSGAGGGR